MRLYDTFARQLVTFDAPQTVRMYVCGITPYDSAHLGHIFTFMTYDLLQRRLEDQGRNIELVRNITDVDEPIYKKANELGIPYMELANREVKSFNEILRRLNFRTLYGEPRASEYIGQMASAVRNMLEHGYAYRLGEDIYFDISKDEHFGELSGYSQTMMRRLMAMRGGDPHRRGKRHPLDFLLWRGITDQADPAAWDTVVGYGRPGWHIECSVMSSELLGLPFDIHGGGDDLIFPHHECEIAQAHSLKNVRVAEHWMHVAPLLLYGEKMSKSLGNLIFAKDLLTDYEPSVIRLALMYYHYRSGGEWRPEFIDQAKRLHEKARHSFNRMGDRMLDDLINDIRAALDDNLDTPRVMRLIDDYTSRTATQTEMVSSKLHELTELTGITF